MRAGEIRIASEEVRANYIKTVVLLVLIYTITRWSGKMFKED